MRFYSHGNVFLLLVVLVVFFLILFLKDTCLRGCLIHLEHTHGFHILQHQEPLMSWILQKMEKRAVVFPPLPSKSFLSLGFIGTLRLVRGCSCSRMCESYTKTEVEKHVTYFDRTAGSSCQLICTCWVFTVPYITLNKSREGFPSKSLHPSADQTSSDRMILEDQLWSDFFFL